MTDTGQRPSEATRTVAFGLPEGCLETTPRRGADSAVYLTEVFSHGQLHDVE